MEKSNYECYNCRNFQRYFVKKKTDFKRTKFGYCGEKQENMCARGKCEQFKHKKIVYKTDTVIARKLDGLLAEISVLRMILEEDVREYAERKKL